MADKQPLTFETAKANLLRNLEFLSDQKNLKIMNDSLFSNLERLVANDRKFYNKKTSIESTFINTLKGIVGKTSSDDIAKDIAQKHIGYPFGIFADILKLEVSDIFIVSDRVSMTKNNFDAATEIIIPDHLLETYSEMVDTFIFLTMYSSNLEKTKFDRRDAILDYTTAGMRFNVAHNALNAQQNGRPIISIRKQIIKSSSGINTDSDSYINSIGLSDNQKNFVNNISMNGSYCIFGETGSGKTTLLKYMGGYKINEKRNLITIEDTPELFLPINIAYLTNDNFRIQDLFKITLRENPSHVIVGETRGEEIVDILESALVFRCGTSIHADSLSKAIMRIVFMVKGSDLNSYNTDDINSLITSTMDGFIYMKNRKVEGIWKRKDINDCDMNNALKNYEQVC